MSVLVVAPNLAALANDSDPKSDPGNARAVLMDNPRNLGGEGEAEAFGGGCHVSSMHNGNTFGNTFPEESWAR